MTNPERLRDLAGRRPERADGRNTHQKLIDSVQRYVVEHGSAPDRLAEVAAEAGVSTATAYRHFASLDDLIEAFVLELPTRAVELFTEAGGDSGSSEEALHRWNRAWVDSCLEHGPLAVYLRSPVGFLKRRAENDPVISYACAWIEPLLEPFAGDPLLKLFVWNVTSDPREVLDLHQLGWGPDRIARFVTETVLATPDGGRHSRHVR